jgi:hypothetical protein
MLLMGIWAHPYTVTLVQVWPTFGNGVWVNLNDAVWCVMVEGVKSFRLHTPFILDIQSVIAP